MAPATPPNWLPFSPPPIREGVLCLGNYGKRLLAPVRQSTRQTLQTPYKTFVSQHTSRSGPVGFGADLRCRFAIGPPPRPGGNGLVSAHTSHVYLELDKVLLQELETEIAVEVGESHC
jgi:hypothetical protein